MKLTIKRFAGNEYGRRWYHRFAWLDGAFGPFNHPGKVKRTLSWSSEELLRDK
ncbi:hypothetical protein [Pantoea vagans]|uniref:hypothetical protein n=1 Tax=Pantoea vagans TaxID=470934 RepID=UPI0030160B2F